ncbi:MAG: carboxyl transferase domain-containing protein [Candidatus Coproplasma sp.]
MDKIKLLQDRRNKLLSAGKSVREDIAALVDKDSFVETSAFSFSESEFYDGTAEGEGVVCGFATIDDCPYYIVAQNAQVLNGGVSKANCQKIVKCLDQAEKNGTPVIYLLSSGGVRVGEGVNVLEGLAELVLKASRLKDSVTQYLVVNGDVFGQVALLAGVCDFNFFVEGKSVLALNSPMVISAAGNAQLTKEKVGAYEALNKTCVATFKVDNLSSVREKIVAVNELVNVEVCDCDELNVTLSKLNKCADANALMQVFDKGSLIELMAGTSPDVKCCLGRIGGISVAAVVFDGGADGVKLCPGRMRKLNAFATIASQYNLPFVTFVNTLGAKETPDVANSSLILEISEYVRLIDSMNSAKISVVYGKAVGLGYTLFAAKNMGYDYTYAFANAKIALFDSVQGAEIEFNASASENKDKLIEKYADENSDPVNAAKGGFVDNIIEPAFVRQYLIASLQMLIK